MFSEIKPHNRRDLNGATSITPAASLDRVTFRSRKKPTPLSDDILRPVLDSYSGYKRLSHKEVMAIGQELLRAKAELYQVLFTLPVAVLLAAKISGHSKFNTEVALEGCLRLREGNFSNTGVGLPASFEPRRIIRLLADVNQAAYRRFCKENFPLAGFEQILAENKLLLVDLNSASPKVAPLFSDTHAEHLVVDVMRDFREIMPLLKDLSVVAKKYRQDPDVLIQAVGGRFFEIQSARSAFKSIFNKLNSEEEDLVSNASFTLFQLQNKWILPLVTLLKLFEEISIKWEEFTSIRNKLVEPNLRLGIKPSMNFGGTQHAKFENLQYANLGLLRAAWRFDVEEDVNSRLSRCKLD
ncbi:MAG: hypothetical protein R3A13_03980 [Bdellovibrionota bacterium]